MRRDKYCHLEDIKQSKLQNLCTKLFVKKVCVCLSQCFSGSQEVVGIDLFKYWWEVGDHGAMITCMFQNDFLLQEE